MQADPSLPPASPLDLFLMQPRETNVNVPVLPHLLLLLLSAAATWDDVIPPVWADKQLQKKCLIRPLW